MLRRFAVFAATILVASGAHAEVWMVKSSGVIGCRDRDALATLKAGAGAVPDGCVELYSGERLLERPNVAGGFADTLEVQRGDSSWVFVRSSDLVADPGIGSVTDDRRE